MKFKDLIEDTSHPVDGLTHELVTHWGGEKIHDQDHYSEYRVPANLDNPTPYNDHLESIGWKFRKVASGGMNMYTHPETGGHLAVSYRPGNDYVSHWRHRPGKINPNRGDY